MADRMQPDQAARRFFFALQEYQCQISWALFSGASQKKFADWTLQDLTQRNSDAVKSAQLGIKEIRLMFERNDPSLIKFFWKRFFLACGAYDLIRYGYFTVDSIKGKNAIVKVTLKYPNGQVREIGLPMVNERGGWKLAYVEHNLPF